MPDRFTELSAFAQHDAEALTGVRRPQRIGRLALQDPLRLPLGSRRIGKGKFEQILHATSTPGDRCGTDEPLTQPFQAGLR